MVATLESHGAGMANAVPATIVINVIFIRMFIDVSRIARLSNGERTFMTCGRTPGEFCAHDALCQRRLYWLATCADYARHPSASARVRACSGTAPRNRA